MSKARVRFTAEDKKEIARLIGEAKKIQGVSNAALARNTGFAESTIGRAVAGTSDTMDGVYIAVMKELGFTYTPAKESGAEDDSNKILQTIMTALEFSYEQVEHTEDALLKAQSELKEAKALLDEAYEKLKKLAVKNGETL